MVDRKKEEANLQGKNQSPLFVFNILENLLGVYACVCVAVCGVCVCACVWLFVCVFLYIHGLEDLHFGHFG